MTWLDLFKKKEPYTTIKASIEDLEELIELEIRKYDSKTEEVKLEIKRNLDSLISDLKSQIISIRSVDINERKEHERIKLIVKENLQIYAAQLERFVENLENIEANKKVDEYALKIESLLNEFKNSSRKSFEKATILVGDEIGKVYRIIEKFTREVDLIIKDKSPIFNKIKGLSDLKSIKSELATNNQTKSKITLAVKNIEQMEKDLMNEKESTEKEYEEFKKSSEFIELTKEKENTIKEINSLNEEVYKIKEKIDIKSLLKNFYGNQKRRDLLNNYRNNFLKTLEEDKDLEIINIIKESSGDVYEEEIIKIKKKNEILKEKSKDKILEDNLTDFERKIKKVDSDISNIKRKIEEEKKKIDRINEKEEHLSKEIKEKTKTLLTNIEII
ncbi:MAG: hypothetical protein Q7S74_02225 [Nanoarchaeota archaeon]|nr:hypothetical protein [Nanoarchaeota archaeon]